MSTLNKPRKKQRKKREGRSITLRIDRLASTPGMVTSPYFQRKGAISRVLAALILIPAMPIILVAILAVRLTSRGPGIYRQTRVGKDGELFDILKIRTMRNDAEAKTGPIWGNANDPRRTRVGRFLRACHIDELPQLINVVRGEMCLIGPRPERPEFVEVLAEKIPKYLDRLAVLPGITGLAQINLPPDTDLDCVRRKVILDLQYIQQAGWWLDFRMLVWSFLRLTCLPAEQLTALLRLGRDVPQSGQRPHQAGDNASSFTARTPGGLGVSPKAGHANGNGVGQKAVATRKQNRRKTKQVRKPR